MMLFRLPPKKRLKYLKLFPNKISNIQGQWTIMVGGKEKGMAIVTDERAVTIILDSVGKNPKFVLTKEGLLMTQHMKSTNVAWDCRWVNEKQIDWIATPSKKTVSTVMNWIRL